MNWTNNDLQNFLRRDQRAKQAALPKSFAEMIERMSKTTTVAEKQNKALKTVMAHGSRYSLPVVLAWFAECGLPEPMPEFRFHSERLWRFDFCWVPQKVACEVNGGLWTGGAHVRGAALLREYAKLNQAAAMGYRVMFVTPDQLCLVETANMIRIALDI